METNVIDINIQQLKQDALDRMLEEMKDNHSSAEDRIHVWLCNQNDEELWNGIMSKSKSIHEAMDYCSSKAKEFATNNVAMIDDNDVFSWVKEYFTAKDLKFKSQPRSKVSTSKAKVDEAPAKTPELTEIQKYIEQNKKVLRKKKLDSEGVEQISLLD